jgi:hypothetical protein
MRKKNNMAKPTKDAKADEKQTAGEFGQFVSGLAKAGVTGQDIVAALSTTKTRRQNADELKKWLKDRPKAKEIKEKEKDNG